MAQSVSTGCEYQAGVWPTLLGGNRHRTPVNTQGVPARYPRALLGVSDCHTGSYLLKESRERGAELHIRFDERCWPRCCTLDVRGEDALLDGQTS